MHLITTPDNPIPEGAQCLPVLTDDGITLRSMLIHRSGASGTCVLLGGRGDFLERYFEASRDLLARKLCVAALDLRGQGGSYRLDRDPPRGHIRSFADFDDDLRAFMTQAVKQRLPPPYYLIAHSAAAIPAVRALMSHNWFSAAVLTAPMFGINFRSWPPSLARFLAKFLWGSGLGRIYLPGVRRTPYEAGDFEGNPLTGDRRRWERDCSTLAAAPQLGLGAPTFGWLAAALRACDELAGLPRGTQLKAPLLAVQAGHERLVDNMATRRLSERIGPMSLAMIAEASHDILQERDLVRSQFWAAFDAFLAVNHPAISKIA